MKKLMISTAAFCVIALLSVSFIASAQSKNSSREKFEKSNLNHKFIQWFNSGQIDSVSFQYLENACMMPEQSPSISGRKNIKEYYTELYKQGFRFEQIKSTSKVVSESIAIDRGIWSLSINSIPIASGNYLSQLHLVNGEWYIENEMSKSDKEVNQEASK